MLPYCILNNIIITTDEPVDNIFLDNLLIYEKNFLRLNNTKNLKLTINAKSMKKEKLNKKKIIQTFTLGVDSFYTLYTNINKIDAILFVVGFDIRTNQKKLIEITLENIRILLFFIIRN